MEFSRAAGKKAIKEHTNLRAGREAGELLAEELEERGREVAERAVELAKEDGRKTVRAQDIKEACRDVKR